MARLRTLPGRAAQPAQSILKRPETTTSTSSARSDPLFTTSKKDKRRIKHAQLMSKVTKATAKPRRRRPNKKLVATLDGLVDALPDDADAKGESGKADGQQVNLIRRKSLKSRPGAMKRRERVDKVERERFGKNMAQMAGREEQMMDGIRDADGASKATGTAKWAALRAFISQTLEQRPDIKIKS